ncbi:hypothetical protein CLOM_g21084 [Closterium sp. NIES-68]|nr:hypothetical protein CLOM_g21084 [Closterium sp. NIES-68]
MGLPGAGKSTLCAALAQVARQGGSEATLISFDSHAHAPRVAPDCAAPRTRGDRVDAGEGSAAAGCSSGSCGAGRLDEAHSGSGRLDEGEGAGAPGRDGERAVSEGEENEGKGRVSAEEGSVGEEGSGDEVEVAPRADADTCPAFSHEAWKSSRLTALAALAATLQHASQGGGAAVATAAATNSAAVPAAAAAVPAVFESPAAAVPAHIIIADDTMHLRSMRLHLLRLAERCEMAPRVSSSTSAHPLTTA